MPSAARNAAYTGASAEVSEVPSRSIGTRSASWCAMMRLKRSRGVSVDVMCCVCSVVMRRAGRVLSPHGAK